MVLDYCTSCINYYSLWWPSLRFEEYLYSTFVDWLWWTWRRHFKTTL